MLVFHKEGLVLFAVPKTGTTSIEGAFSPRASVVLRDPPNLKHTTVQQFYRLVRPMLARPKAPAFESIAIVRDPIDWLGSWYRYRHRDEIAGHRNSTRGMSFDQFVRDYMRAKPGPAAAVGSQSRFLLAPKGLPGIDHLFRYEELGRAVDFLQDRLSQQVDLPFRNVSPQMSLSLSPDIEAEYREAHAKEFDLWLSAKG